MSIDYSLFPNLPNDVIDIIFEYKKRAEKEDEDKVMQWRCNIIQDTNVGDFYVGRFHGLDRFVWKNMPIGFHPILVDADANSLYFRVACGWYWNVDGKSDQPFIGADAIASHILREADIYHDYE